MGTEFRWLILAFDLVETDGFSPDTGSKVTYRGPWALPQTPFPLPPRPIDVMLAEFRISGVAAGVSRDTCRDQSTITERPEHVRPA